MWEITPVEIDVCASAMLISECGRIARPMRKPGSVQATTAWFAATESYDSGLRVQKYIAGDPSAPTASGASTSRASAPGNTVIDGLGVAASGPGTSGIVGRCAA